MDMGFSLNSLEKLDVLKATENLIIKVNEISELNLYKMALFNGLYTTEFLESIDSLVLQEFAETFKLDIHLPVTNLRGNWVKMDFKWGSFYIISNINYN